MLTLVLFIITIPEGLLAGKKQECKFNIERQGETDAKVTKPGKTKGKCVANLIHVEVSGQQRSKELKKKYSKNVIVMWPNGFPEKKQEWALFKGDGGDFFWSKFETDPKKKRSTYTGTEKSRKPTGERLNDADMITKMTTWAETKKPNPYTFLMEKNGAKTVWAHGKKTKAMESIYDLYDVYEEEEEEEEDDDFSYADVEEETALENELDDAFNEMFLAGYERGQAAAQKRKRYRYQY